MWVESDAADALTLPMASAQIGTSKPLGRVPRGLLPAYWIGHHLQLRAVHQLGDLFYPAAGFYLSRVVLRNIIQWHPMYDTLYNVTSAKLGFFAAWPLWYPFLFFRLGINKIL